MQRVTTQHTKRAMRFTLDDGSTTEHSFNFNFNGREYYFFGNVFYDLEDDLIDHIFGR